MMAPDYRETPPANAPVSGEAWRCPRCGHLLGIVAAGWLFWRYKGRRLTAKLPARVYCQECKVDRVREG